MVGTCNMEQFTFAKCSFFPEYLTELNKHSFSILNLVLRIIPIHQHFINLIFMFAGSDHQMHVTWR